MLPFSFIMEDRNKNLPIRIELLCLIVIVVLAAVMMRSKTKELEQKKQEAIAREELLEQQIQEQKDRTADLEDQKTYVKTDEYIEEIARDKLGLINPDEVLFKEKEED